ncbi:MAG: hypothetical protein ACRD1T_17705 [Acidimicrobiia bacterium]
MIESSPELAMSGVVQLAQDRSYVPGRAACGQEWESGLRGVGTESSVMENELDVLVAGGEPYLCSVPLGHLGDGALAEFVQNLWRVEGVTLCWYALHRGL